MANELTPPDQRTSSTFVAAQRLTPLSAGDPFGGEEGAANFTRYFAALKRYRWLVTALTLLGALGGFGASRLLKPKYAASATLWIQSSDQSQAQLNAGPIRPDELLHAAGWEDLLRSYIVLDEVVRRMRLFVSTDRGDTAVVALLSTGDRYIPGHYQLDIDGTGHGFVLSNATGVIVQRGTVGDSIGNVIGLHWVPPASSLSPGQTIGFSLRAARDAAQELGDRLGVRMDENGNFLSVSLTGPNPLRTAAIVNAVVEREVEVATDLKKAKLTELTKILEDQLNTAGTNLKSAENQLETFRIHTATLPSDQATPLAPGLVSTTNPVMNSFFQMKIDQGQMRRDHDAIVRVLAQVPDSGLSVDALLVIPAVQTSTELKTALDELNHKQADLRALRYKYTDANPTVATAAAEVDSLERQTIPSLARALLSQMAMREQTLDARVASAGSDLQAIPARTIEEARLQRGVNIAENLYTTLQARYEEAHLAEASSIPDVRPLDEALPPQFPVSNTGPKIILLGFIAGLGLGLAGAILLDRLDTRVRYPEQVTSELGLPILGTLPRVNKNGDPHSDEMSHVVESLRSIRLNLAHAYGAAGPLLVTVSSPGSGDGKSFLSSNLAIAFADAGFNTLLIDGDLRRGALHRVLKAQRKPGLTDFLTGDLPKERVIQATPYPLLSFIGGGTRKQTAPELLGTPAMRELVMGLRSTYNVILIDSPPLGAAVDPFLLATLTGNLVVVLRTGATDRQLARAKLEMLDRLPVRILGAVLNDVRADGIYRYYGYLAGYEAEEERDAGKRIPRAVSTAG